MYGEKVNGRRGRFKPKTRWSSLLVESAQTLMDADGPVEYNPQTLPHLGLLPLIHV